MATTWLLRDRGEWQSLTDPLPEDVSLQEALAQLGYNASPEVGWSSPTHQFNIDVYAGDPSSANAEAAPALFLVVINTASRWWPVYVDSTPRLMEVLAEWTPMVQHARTSP